MNFWEEQEARPLTPAETNRLAQAISDALPKYQNTDGTNGFICIVCNATEEGIQTTSNLDNDELKRVIVSFAKTILGGAEPEEYGTFRPPSRN